MSGKYLRRFEDGEAESLAVPSAVQGKRLLIRGTEAWNERERARARAGCHCLSWSTIPANGGKLVHI